MASLLYTVVSLACSSPVNTLTWPLAVAVLPEKAIALGSGAKLVLHLVAENRSEDRVVRMLLSKPEDGSGP